MNQKAKAEAFKALHERPGTFVIPNPWDAGTARILTSLGYEAMATTSGGLAFALGRPDGQGALSRDEVLANARVIVEATHLPVSADLESGYGDTADEIGETYRRAAAMGLVGGSIEDATGDPARPIFEFGEAVERVRAAVKACRALPFPFTLTARAENFLYGRRDLDDTIRRLKAYAEAGADVLYAPAVNDPAALKTLCASVGKPVNALTGSKGALSVAQLAEAGARRISVGSAFSRAAIGAFIAAAREVRDHGTFRFGDAAIPYAEINGLLSGKS